MPRPVRSKGRTSRQPPTAADGSDTRLRVLQATVDCILDEGFYRASSNRIAERAGVTWGVIQHHFGTREALLVEVFKWSRLDLLHTLKEAEVTGDNLRDRLESFADVLWSFYRQPKFIAYAQLALNLVHDPHTAAATRAAIAEMDAEIGRRINTLLARVVDRETAAVLPRSAILHTIRGLGMGLAFNDALREVPVTRRRRDPERTVLLDALTALVDGARSHRGAGASSTTLSATSASTAASS